MAYVPDRGDIIHLQFDPAAGHEISGKHFALVLSSELFNQRGLAVVCPISQGVVASARSYGTLVTLMGCGTETQGAVHCHQIKALDWQARHVKRKENVPRYIVDEVMARIEAIIFQ